MQGVPAEFWERTAARYDRQRWLERAAIRTAVELLGPVPGDRVLDVGTGTGAVLHELAGLPAPPVGAIGLDASPAMLARVGELPPGWTTVTGDAAALPFDDSSFDAACAAYVLHVVPSDALPRIAGEMRRVLRPGGRLVTVTPAIPDAGAVRPVARALDRLARLAPVRLGGLAALDVRPVLREAGFTVAATRETARGYPSQCVRAERGRRRRKMHP